MYGTWHSQRHKTQKYETMRGNAYAYKKTLDNSFDFVTLFYLMSCDDSSYLYLWCKCMGSLAGTCFLDVLFYFSIYKVAWSWAWYVCSN